MIAVDNYIITCARQAVKIELMEQAIDALREDCTGKARMIEQLEKEAEDKQDG